MHESPINSLAIIGLGLIGGSIAAAVKERGLATEIRAWDASQNALDLGRDLGLIDRAADSVADATQDADLVVLAVPVQATAEVFSAFRIDDQIVTDVGSVKLQVLEAARAAYGEVPAGFVPGHPIAGSEKHGVAAANPALFRQHRVILTPTDTTDPAAVARVTFFWEELGAQVITMSPDHHDEVLAQTSHLPHLLAYALVDTLSSGGDSLEVFQYAAGGFRDFSRIAASDPTMWSDIFAANRQPVLEVLDRYLGELGQLRTLIEQGDGESLKRIFKRAKAARDHFSSISFPTNPRDPDHE